jgi:hypothetical protein
MVLNAELRKSLSVSKPKLIDSVYLALSKGRETSYYVDGTAVGLIFDRLAKTTFRLGISSARHATELLTANVATTDTFSQRALSNGGFYLADLNSSGYLNKLPAFDLSERSMFSSGLLCFETIGQCNGSFLTAFYRRDHESELRSALHAAKPKLCKKFSRRISGFEKVTDYFRRLRKPAAIELVSEIAAETIVKTTDKFAGRP